MYLATSYIKRMHIFRDQYFTGSVEVGLRAKYHALYQ